MKKILIFLLFVMLLLNVSCKKDTKTTVPTNSVQETATMYVKYQSWSYTNDSDLEKPSKDVKEKKLMEFANKVTVIGSKKVGDKEFVQIQIPDKSKFWIEKKYLVTKFITINLKDVNAYKQPDEGYLNAGFKLQTGDFAYFNKEESGFINVEFITYMPRGKNNEVVWVGNVWIKDGFTEDLKAAKESYFLAIAYKELYGKNKNVESAKEKLKEALDVNGGTETEITPVVKALLSELEGKKTDSTSDKK